MEIEIGKWKKAQNLAYQADDPLEISRDKLELRAMRGERRDLDPGDLVLIIKAQ